MLSIKRRNFTKFVLDNPASLFAKTQNNESVSVEVTFSLRAMLRYLLFIDAGLHIKYNKHKSFDTNESNVTSPTTFNGIKIDTRQCQSLGTMVKAVADPTFSGSDELVREDVQRMLNVCTDGSITIA